MIRTDANRGMVGEADFRADVSRRGARWITPAFSVRDFIGPQS